MRIPALAIACTILCVGCAAVAPGNGDVRDGRVFRLRSYTEAAKVELAKTQCDRDVTFLHFADEQEIYRGTCKDGQTRMVQCDPTACRLIK